MPDDMRHTAPRQAILSGQGPQASPAPRLPRDRRIDVFRGLALAMIFVDHVPGTGFEKLTSGNFGFSDAAEVFVYLSGLSAALAYADRLTMTRIWPGVSRIWSRAWTLYLVHLLITVWAIGIAAATMRFAGDASLFTNDNVQVMLTDLTGILTGLPLMTHQLGYVNILPTYTALLIACPWLIRAGLRSARATAAGSLALWAAAGLWGLNLPNYPLSGGWFLNPFSWQLLFVSGILTGLALRRGERLVPRRPALQAGAAAVLLVALVWAQWPAFAAAGNGFMAGLADLGIPGLIRNFDKTFLCVPRLIHALALFYLISSVPQIARLCNSRWSEPLATLGRNALAVFAFGTVLAFAARALRTLADQSLLIDSAVVLGGLLLLWLFAQSVEIGRRAARQPA